MHTPLYTSKTRYEATKKKVLLLHWQMQSAVHFFPTETVDETAKGSGSVGV